MKKIKQSREPVQECFTYSPIFMGLPVEPELGYQTIGQLRGWLGGRMVDDLRKNALALDAGRRTMTATVDAVAELQLLGYGVPKIRKALRGIRSKEVAPSRRLAGAARPAA